jgi:hypothetical protein
MLAAVQNLFAFANAMFRAFFCGNSKNQSVDLECNCDDARELGSR